MIEKYKAINKTLDIEKNNKISMVLLVSSKQVSNLEIGITIEIYKGNMKILNITKNNKISMYHLIMTKLMEILDMISIIDD